MSFAPHPVLARRWSEQGSTVPGGLAVAAPVLSVSHQEQSARLAAMLLWELLDAIYSKQVSTTEDIRHAVRNMDAWGQLQGFEPLLNHGCYPIKAFQEWLEQGDCQIDTARVFLQKLTGSDDCLNLSDKYYDVLGMLFRKASNWDDDNFGLLKFAINWAQGKSRTLICPNLWEPVLFSQRGLNSVLIAIWCASKATSPWDWIEHVIYCGGDTDTVGAVAGQIVCPLLEPSAVVEAYTQVVALGEPERQHLQVVNATARRFFHRALLFALGDLEAVLEWPSLVDPEYPL